MNENKLQKQRKFDYDVKINLTVVACVSLLISGCAVIDRAGMAVLYKKARLREAQIHRDLPYTAVNSPDQRLDLYTPAGTNWPVMIFVHGGGWTEGDKADRFGGQDVYGNIGRFYAEQGIGVAVINYRLIPKVGWRDQLVDTAAATTWVYSHIGDYGGNRKRLFLFGHSAGSQLVDRVALDSQPLAKAGGSTKIIAGVISVSGAGLDMRDQKTYDLGESPGYFAKFFATEENVADWQTIGSPAAYIHPGAPPFLIIYAGGETKALIHQSQLFGSELSAAQVGNRIVVVPGQSHARIVLTLSRDDRTAGPAIMTFVETCPPAGELR